MKKSMSLILCILMIIALTACGGKENGNANDKTPGKPKSVNDVLEQGMAEADGKDEQEENPEEQAGAVRQNGINENAPEPEISDEKFSSTDGIDIDLTALSSTMVYSEVYHMMVSPDTYIGKTVKMAGQLALYHDEITDKYYFACIISDATACCSQGIEFELTDDYTYPDDYPEEGGEICVVGTFDTYREGNYTYCTLRNARKA